MQTGKKALDKKPNETSIRSSVLRKWLRILSIHFEKEITAENATIYERGLADIGDAELEEAFKQCLLALQFLPKVADIRAKAGKRSALILADRCQIEWEAIMGYARKWNADVGWKAYMGQTMPQPEISCRAEYALRCCGGYLALARVAYDDTQLVFRKRDFEAAYSRHSEMEAAGIKPLTQGEARALLGLAQNVTRIADKSAG